MKNKQIIIFILVAVVAAGAGFFGGMQYQKRQRVAFTAGQLGGQRGGPNGQQAGQGGNRTFGGGAGQGFRPIMGEVSSMDDKSITVKMPDGSSKIVILSDKTTFNKSSEGTKADLKVGEEVSAFGTPNSDGSITAQSVSVGGGFRMMMGNGSPTPTPAK